jgi:exportin-T
VEFLKLSRRGIHHPDETVRRRSFWEFTRFVRECKTEMNPDMAAPILESMRVSQNLHCVLCSANPQDLLVINPVLVEADTPDEDVLLKAATTPSYLTDQLHLFEAAGSLVYITRSDTAKHMALLEALAGPLMAAIGDGLQRPTEPLAILQVHHYLMALGNFAKGFPSVSDKQIEALPYTPAFKQMTEALLEALNVMKTQRIVRDSARFAFSQFVTAIGSTIAELVPRFVSSVVTEFVASELVDFILFLNLLMHRLKVRTRFLSATPLLTA